MKPHSARRPKTLVLLISIMAIVFHLQLFSWLGTASRALSAAIQSEEGGTDWRRLEAVQAIVSIARLASLLSAGVAAVGCVGIVKDHLPFLRLFTLNSFISLSFELLLMLIVAFLAISASKQSSFISTTCEAISSADLPLDLFGYDLTSCEESFGSLLVSALGVLAAASLLRAWASFRLLEYYTALARGREPRSTRSKPALSIDTRRHPYTELSNGSARSPSPSSKRHHSDHSSSIQPHQRIFLLPSSHRKSNSDNIPLLSLTAPSPNRESFPPAPSTSASAAPLSTIVESPTSTEQQRYLVYAPVMMSAEEARLVGAKEIVIGSHHHGARARTRHNSSRPSPREREASGGSPTSSSTVTASSSVHGGDPASPAGGRQGRDEDDDELETPVALPSNPMDASVELTAAASQKQDKGKGKQA